MCQFNSPNQSIKTYCAICSSEKPDGNNIHYFYICNDCILRNYSNYNKGITGSYKKNEKS